MNDERTINFDAALEVARRAYQQGWSDAHLRFEAKEAEGVTA